MFLRLWFGPTWSVGRDEILSLFTFEQLRATECELLKKNQVMVLEIQSVLARTTKQRMGKREWERKSSPKGMASMPAGLRLRLCSDCPPYP